MRAEDFQRVVKGAGFARTEMATLYGVSRQTIHYWIVTGMPREGSYLDRMATVITAALLVAIERKLLPLASMSVEARARKIDSMARTVQSLKPAPVK